MALAGMVAALGAGSWYVFEQGPAIVANAAARTGETVEHAALGTIIARKGLDPAAQEALMGQLQERYPRAAEALASWTPVTAAKIAALHEAYQGLSEAERTSIVRDVGHWQAQVWKQYPAIRDTWAAGGTDREVQVAKQAMQLDSAERNQLDTSTAALWRQISQRNPRWAQQVDAIMSGK
jgi:hypothetical protein